MEVKASREWTPIICCFNSRDELWIYYVVIKHMHASIYWIHGQIFCDTHVFLNYFQYVWSDLSLLQHSVRVGCQVGFISYHVYLCSLFTFYLERKIAY